MFTGDATGVENAVDAAIATVIKKVWGETPRSLATAIATGAIKTVVAVFDMNRLKVAVEPVEKPLSELDSSDQA